VFVGFEFLVHELRGRLSRQRFDFGAQRSGCLPRPSAPATTVLWFILASWRPSATRRRRYERLDRSLDALDLRDLGTEHC
jgi:hypothetical protein